MMRGRQSRQEQFRWRNIRIKDLVAPAVGLAVLAVLAVLADVALAVLVDVALVVPVDVAPVVLVVAGVVPAARVDAMVVTRPRTCMRT